MGGSPAPAGWYDDPRGGGGLRYWDGSRWTEMAHAGQGAAGIGNAPPVAVAAGPQAGWYSDPTRRHYLRLWNGSAWTEHVIRADGMRAVDPPFPTAALAAMPVRAPQPAGYGYGGPPHVPPYGQQFQVPPPQPQYGYPAQAPPQAYGPPLYVPPGSSAARRTRVSAIALVGGIAVVVAAILPWFNSVQGGEGANGLDVPVTFLFDPAGAGDGLKVGLVLLLLGAAAAGLAFVPGGRLVRRVIGSLATAIGLLFVSAVLRLVSDLGGGVSPFEVIGVGAYVSVVGGVLVGAGR